MKKILLSMAVALSFGVFASTAAETTITAYDLCGQSSANVKLNGETKTNSGFSFTFAKNAGATDPEYYNNGQDVRLYAKNTMKVTGTNITKMVFTASDIKRACDMTVSSGTMTFDKDSKIYTWTGDAASEITFTVPDKSNTSATEAGKPAQFRWNQVVITADKDETTSEAPVIAPASGTIVPEGGLTVTITAAQGAKIYYTTDGATPSVESDEYVNPIVLMHAATVKAIAVETGKNPSSVVTAEYKEAAASVANIKAFLDKADTDNEVVITGPVVVSGEFTYGSGQSLYVQDETGYLLIFDKNKKLPAYQPGDRLSNIAGTYTLYNDVAQMTPDVASFGAGVAGELPAAKPVTVTEPTKEMTSEYVKLSDVGIETSASNEKDHYAVSGSDKILLFNRFNITFPADAADGYDVYGYVAYYVPKEGDPVVQIYPAEIREAGAKPETYEVATIAEFLQKATADESKTWTITGNVKTVYQNGKNLYLQDVEAPYTGILAFGEFANTYEPGTLLSGIKGSYKDYFSTDEFVAVVSTFGEGTQSEAPVATKMDLADVTADNQNLYVEFSNVTVSDYDADAKTFAIEDEKNDTFQGYNKWDKTVTVPADTKLYNVFGFISYYQAKGAAAPALQFYPIAFYDAAGVEGISGDNTAAKEYYTIEGLRVAEPEQGIYIVRQGSKTYKVIVRK